MKPSPPPARRETAPPDRLRQFWDAHPSPLLGLSPDGVVREANLAGRTLLESLRSAMGQPAPDVLAPLWSGQQTEIEVACGGRVYCFQALRPEGADVLWLQGQDVTRFKTTELELRQSLAAARAQALHDPLTGLANRLLLEDRLAQAIALSQRHRRRTGLAYLDLDGFKAINEQQGHRFGDQVLAQTAARLQQVIRRSDTLARVGGDEMVLVLPDLRQAAAAETVCARVQAALRDLEVQGRACRLGISIGLALHPDDAPSSEGLLEQADQALRAAKAQGGGRVVRAVPERAEGRSEQ